MIPARDADHRRDPERTCRLDNFGFLTPLPPMITSGLTTTRSGWSVFRKSRLASLTGSNRSTRRARPIAADITKRGARRMRLMNANPGDNSRSARRRRDSALSNAGSRYRAQSTAILRFLASGDTVSGKCSERPHTIAGVDGNVEIRTALLRLSVHERDVPATPLEFDDRGTVESEIAGLIQRKEDSARALWHSMVDVNPAGNVPRDYSVRDYPVQ